MVRFDARVDDVSRRDPFASLFAAIAPTIDPPTDDAAFLRSLFVSRRLRKGEYYQRAGEVTTHGAFVVHGRLRTYSLDPDGTESIVYLSAERNRVGDVRSAGTRLPTTYYVDATEPADLLDAAKRSMPCHRSQFAPEVAGRVLPEMDRAWSGKVAFIPVFPVTSTTDLS